MRCVHATCVVVSFVLASMMAACGASSPADSAEQAQITKSSGPRIGPAPTAVDSLEPTSTASPTASPEPAGTTSPTPTVTPGILPTLESVPTPLPAYPTPSPQPGGGFPNVGVSDPHMVCETRQRISGYFFEPHTTVTVLSRVPGSDVVYLGGTTETLDDGSFYVVLPAGVLMPWCDPASGVAVPEHVRELYIEVWTTSDAAGNPTLAHDPHFVYSVTVDLLHTAEITADEAMRRVYGYRGGDPTIVPEGMTVREIYQSQFALNTNKRYLVTVDWMSADPPPGEYVVDAGTGQIVSMYHPRATSTYAPRAARDVTEAQARRRAEVWGLQTFEGFDRLEFVSGLTYGGFSGIVGSPEADRVYTATWRLRDPVSGGWLPTGFTISIDLETDRELSYEAVLVGNSGPTLYLSTEQIDCSSEVYVSGDEFLSGSTVEIYGWPQGGNGSDLVADPVVVEEGGSFSVVLDLARFTGCGHSQGEGAYTKRFGITAVTRRNPDDPLNGYADPAAVTYLTIYDLGTEATPSPSP